MPQVPNNTKVLYVTGGIDLVNDTIKVALYNNSTAFTFDPDTHAHVADVLDGGTTAQEFGGAGGTGYTRKALASQTVTQDDTDDESVFDAGDLSWSSLNGETIQGILIYKQVGGDDTTPADDPIIGVIDDADEAELPLPTNGSQIDLNWAAEGIKNLFEP